MCFSTYEVFKEELKQAFEPPQNEFRSRAEFLDLQQGKHDVHAYAQRARYLVSNIVTNPIDEATKVVTFMKGLRDGPVKTYLFREYPSTLEAAITLAMQEEFSLRQAKLHANVPRPQPRPVARTGGPEPMDLSNVTTAGYQQQGAGLHDEAPCDQAGLDTARPRTGSAGEQLSTTGPGPEEQLCGAGLRTTRRRRKRRTLLKSRSGTETHQEQSAGQTEAVTPDVETLSVLTRTNTGFQYREMELANPPTTASELTSLPAMSWKRFTRDLHDGRIEQVCVLSNSEKTGSESEGLRQLFMGSTTESEDTLSAKTKRERFEEQGWDSLKSSPYYELLREYKDVLPEEIPAELPQDKGIQHEIDLVPGTKYCVTRQWPQPREQVKAIDEFFESHRKAGQVRESKSPHSTPTFCVKKPQGGWRIVHAYNKLNDATVPAQTPIPRKDVIIDSMAGSTVYSALDLRDGFYQILMRESDTPLTTVSTPSGMLWEWLVMPQGLKNALVTFNRCVAQLLRSVRDFEPSYFDDVFNRSQAVDGKTDIEMHRVHLRKLLELMRKDKLYANLKKCIFGVSEIPVLGYLVGKNGVRPGPEKDISDVRRHTPFSRATSTGTTSISGCASTSVLARYANA
ncbi:reverse transcriptase [Phytophthora cinnamomi]|uniref:reverse transcriptase n=1 Tax=Phytophthora cinnamomi TaxID=4785 RepID=UPI00355AC4A6|nr:reverse transcriptase [Phytophthora cinnamomi]